LKNGDQVLIYIDGTTNSKNKQFETKKYEISTYRFSYFDASLIIAPSALAVEMIEKIGFQGILFG